MTEFLPRRGRWGSLISTVGAVAGTVRTVLLVVFSDLGVLNYTSGYVHPFMMIWAPPDDIERISGRNNAHKKAWSTSGLVVDGNWDENGGSFVEESEWYECLHDRYVIGTPWIETTAVQSRLERVQNGDVVMDNRTTVDGVFERCRYLDRTYAQIKEQGYLCQPELIDRGNGTPYDKVIPYKRYYHEVAVDIGRNGELLFVDGRHRLSFAKILGVEKIPVRIVAVHKRFAESDRKLEYDAIDAGYGHPFCPFFKSYTLPDPKYAI